MQSQRRLRRRIVDKYHVISRAVKRFRRKPSTESNDGPGEGRPVETEDVSKAPMNILLSEPVPQPNGTDWGGPDTTSGGTPAIPVIDSDTAPKELVPTREKQSSVLGQPSDNLPVEHAHQVTAVRRMATADEGLRILSADGSGIHPDWQDFIDHAIAIENVIDPNQPNITSGDDVTCSSSRFFGCVFATDSVQKAFEVPRTGDIENSIVLGLKSAGAASNNVLSVDLLSAFAVDTSNLKEPVASIISVFSSEIGSVSRRFSVVNEDGFKNACWIRALDVNTLEVKSYCRGPWKTTDERSSDINCSDLETDQWWGSRPQSDTKLSPRCNWILCGAIQTQIFC